MSLPLYQPTPFGVVPRMQTGQWVKVEGYAKKARFVRYRPDGSAYLVMPNGRGKRAKVSLAAFRLACGKGVPNVLPALF